MAELLLSALGSRRGSLGSLLLLLDCLPENKLLLVGSWSSNPVDCSTTGRPAAKKHSERSAKPSASGPRV